MKANIYLIIAGIIFLLILAFTIGYNMEGFDGYAFKKNHDGLPYVTLEDFGIQDHEGFDEGYEHEGFGIQDEGFDEGYEHEGFGIQDEGFDEGYEHEGFGIQDEGFDEGFDEGYDEGFDEGYEHEGFTALNEAYENHEGLEDKQEGFTGLNEAYGNHGEEGFEDKHMVEGFTGLQTSPYGVETKLDVFSQLPANKTCPAIGLHNSMGNLCLDEKTRRLMATRGGNATGRPDEFGSN